MLNILAVEGRQNALNRRSSRGASVLRLATVAENDRSDSCFGVWPG